MDHLKTSSDWHVIEENLSNILCCHLESEFNRSNLDPNLCKLFQLAQISIDYLLQIRQQTLKELKACQDQVQDSKSVMIHRRLFLSIQIKLSMSLNGVPLGT